MMTIFQDVKWNKTLEQLRNGRSVILHAPLHYGKSYFKDCLLEDENLRTVYYPVQLGIPNDEITNSPYEQVWKNITVQLSIKSSKIGKGKIQFVNAMLDLIKSQRILCIIQSHGKNRGCAAAIIDALQEVSLKAPRATQSRICVVVLDDYTLYYYENKVRDNSSFWDFSLRVIFGQFTASHALSKMLIQHQFPGSIADIILELTGGHQGLIIEALNYLKWHKDELDMISLRADMKQYLENSSIMDSLRRSIYKYSKENLQLLAKFTDGKLTERYNDPDIIEFHKLGIVLKVSSSRSQLCSGIITELLQEVLLENSGKDASSKITGPEKILFICSSPRDTNPFDFGKEYKRINEALLSSRKRDQYLFMLEPGVVKSELLKMLMRHQPSIIHISMHGTVGEGLFFEGPQGEIQPMDAEEFQKVIALYTKKHPLRLVTLSTCNSLGHAEKIKTYCSYVMGTQAEIPERATVAYAEGFYVTLFNENQDPDMQFCHEAGILAIEQADPRFKKVGDLEVKDIPKFIKSQI